MTFVTVIRTNSFPVGTVEVVLENGYFTGNLQGNVINGTIVEATTMKTDHVVSKTPTGTISFLSNISTAVIMTDNIKSNSANVINVLDTLVMKNAGNSICFTGGIQIGYNTTSDIYGGMAIGIGATSIGYGLAIGFSAHTQLKNALALGSYTHAYGYYSTAIGFRAIVTGDGSVSIGVDSNCIGNDSVALGTGAVVTNNNCIQLGQATNSGTNGTLKFRSQQVSSESWIGGGLTGASIDNSGNIIRGTGGGGWVDTATSNLNMACYALGNVARIDICPTQPVLIGNDQTRSLVTSDTVSVAVGRFSEVTNYSVSIGYQAGKSYYNKTSGNLAMSFRNVAIGYNALYSGVYGFEQHFVAVGFMAAGSFSATDRATSVVIGSCTSYKNYVMESSVCMGFKAAQI
jgi:hypothetical protein